MDDSTADTIDLNNIEEIDFDREYRLPTPEDTFIKSSGSKTLYTQSIAGNWSVYTESYKQAADLIVSQIEGNPPECRLPIPLIFFKREKR